jgi:hypothetical protein
MESSTSHPPGFSQRWQGAGSSDSASSARKDHVSGLGISSASSGNSADVQRAEVTLQAPAADQGRVQDRLVWEQPRPSKKTMWRRRVEARNDAAAGRGAVAPEMDGLCFRCYEPGTGSGTAPTTSSAFGASSGAIRPGSASDLGAPRRRRSSRILLWPSWRAAVRRSEVSLLGPGGVLTGILVVRPPLRLLRGRSRRHLRLLHLHPRHRHHHQPPPLPLSP